MSSPFLRLAKDVVLQDGCKHRCIDATMIHELPSVQPDLSDYSDKLWRSAYERGKREAQTEIIHCRECEYGEQDEYERWYCRSLGCQVGDEDGSGFCADAERREDG